MIASSSQIPRTAVTCVLAATAAMAGMLAQPLASAANTATTSMSISTTLLEQCVVSGGAGSGMPSALLDFGSRDALASSVTTTQSPSGGAGALQVQCSMNATPTLAVDLGANAGGSRLRRLSGPGAVLVDYEIHRDSSRTQFVDANPFSLPAITAGVPYVLVLYGRVPMPRQATAEGSYSDAVNITLSY